MTTRAIQFWELWTAVDFARFKAMHQSTVAVGAAMHKSTVEIDNMSFHFTWHVLGEQVIHEFVVGYAKYLIEFLSTTRFK